MTSRLYQVLKTTAQLRQSCASVRPRRKVQGTDVLTLLSREFPYDLKASIIHRLPMLSEIQKAKARAKMKGKTERWQERRPRGRWEERWWKAWSCRSLSEPHQEDRCLSELWEERTWARDCWAPKKKQPAAVQQGADPASNASSSNQAPNQPKFRPLQRKQPLPLRREMLVERAARRVSIPFWRAFILPCP